MDRFRLVPPAQNVSLSATCGAHHFSISRSSLLQAKTVAKGQMHFGFCQQGELSLQRLDGRARMQLGAGMYFALDSAWSVSGDGALLSIVSEDHSGLSMVGGAIEEHGRLRYIDGCTDSLLIPPTKWGDPCLNLLAFPPGVEQTAHRHPSFRAGVVVAGGGECVMDDERIALAPGDFFLIPQNLRHCFFSDRSMGLRVIAFHPDTDFGPTDEVHPMINRTLLAPR